MFLHPESCHYFSHPPSVLNCPPGSLKTLLYLSAICSPNSFTLEIVLPFKRGYDRKYTKKVRGRKEIHHLSLKKTENPKHTEGKPYKRGGSGALCCGQATGKF